MIAQTSIPEQLGEQSEDDERMREDDEGKGRLDFAIFGLIDLDTITLSSGEEEELRSASIKCARPRRETLAMQQFSILWREMDWSSFH